MTRLGGPQVELPLDQGGAPPRGILDDVPMRAAEGDTYRFEPTTSLPTREQAHGVETADDDHDAMVRKVGLATRRHIVQVMAVLGKYHEPFCMSPNADGHRNVWDAVSADTRTLLAIGQNKNVLGHIARMEAHRGEYKIIGYTRAIAHGDVKPKGRPLAIWRRV